MNKLEGSVSLDGKISYTGVTPRFTAHGLSVYRLRKHERVSLIETVGPHIFLQLPPLLLMSMPPASLATGAKYQLAGPGIGSTRMLHGYASADLGSETRHVEQYSLLVTLGSDALVFCIDGWAGSIDESAGQRNKAYASKQDFQIKFVLPEHLFEEVIEHKPAPGVLRKLMQRARNA